MRQQKVGSVLRTGDDGARPMEESGGSIRMLGIDESCVRGIRFFVVLAGHRPLIWRKLPVLTCHSESEAISFGYDENGQSSSHDMKASNATPWSLANVGFSSKTFLIPCA